METLKREGLYGAGLIPVRTPYMVERYNRCLEEIGVSSTSLKRFEIDGLGWSPQIAEEKENPRYLSHGEANQFGIILTPDQEGRPVYMPSHSFDFELMGEYFKTSRPQIANLTTKTALYLDIDQLIDHYHSPLDLLMIDGIRLKTVSVDRLIMAAREQRKMVADFRDEDDLWMNADARSALIASANQYGDLRFKTYIIPEFAFQNVRSFYSQAFGGVFVFRDLTGSSFGHLVILEDSKKYRRLVNDDNNVFALEDRGLYKELEKRNLLELDAYWIQGNPEVLDDLKENLLADALYSHGDKEFNLAEATTAQKKGVVAQLKGNLENEYFEIEALKTKISRADLSIKDISKKMGRLLMRPHSSLSGSMKALIWMTLMKLNPHNVENLYRYSKHQFYNLYRSWPEQRRRWVVSHLRMKGLPN